VNAIVMDVELQYFDGCPSWRIADERLAALAAERSDLRVTHRLVESLDDAERLGFHGSPTILVEGVDPFADARTSVGLSCRLYPTPEGLAGAPTLEQLRAVVAPT
jgi:hypothetical protein